MPVSLQMELNERLFIRDPQQTKLGRKIIKYGIQLIEEIGFEKFTFKKLAERIGSTEASVYRYFENKHNLLVYLVSWYWEWVKFQIDYQTMNINDAEKRLRIVMNIIVEASRDNPAVEHVNESLLHRIVIGESPKAYFTKQVDEENKDGFFLNYKSLCKKVANIMLEISPNYPYPHSLASTLLEMANHQFYFAEHLPSLTDVKYDKNIRQNLVKLLEHFVFELLKTGAKPSK